MCIFYGKKYYILRKTKEKVYIIIHHYLYENTKQYNANTAIPTVYYVFDY